MSTSRLDHVAAHGTGRVPSSIRLADGKTITALIEEHGGEHPAQDN